MDIKTFHQYGKYYTYLSIPVTERVLECLQEHPKRSDDTWETPQVIMARIEAATGYPQTAFGGTCFTKQVDGVYVFSLPGGGMRARYREAWRTAKGEPEITLEICSFGDVVRAVVKVELWAEGIMAHIEPGYQPRERDLARARMWAAIVQGVDPYDAARANGLGNNIGHAHAGFPALSGEEDSKDTALRLLALGYGPYSNGLEGNYYARVRDEESVVVEAGRRYLEQLRVELEGA